MTNKCTYPSQSRCKQCSSSRTNSYPISNCSSSNSSSNSNFKGILWVARYRWTCKTLWQSQYSNSQVLLQDRQPISKVPSSRVNPLISIKRRLNFSSHLISNSYMDRQPQTSIWYRTSISRSNSTILRHLSTMELVRAMRQQLPRVLILTSLITEDARPISQNWYRSRT